MPSICMHVTYTPVQFCLTACIKQKRDTNVPSMSLPNTLDDTILILIYHSLEHIVLADIFSVAVSQAT